MPCTQQSPRDYQEGWVWEPPGDEAVHFQADIPVAEPGWYAARVTTSDGRVVGTEEVLFEAEEANAHSRELDTVVLRGHDVDLVLRGYGEEMPLREVRVPFEGDHWWYAQHNYWSLRARLGGEERAFQGGSTQVAARFRGGR